MTNLLELMVAQNPWWKTGKCDTRIWTLKKRFLFDELVKYLDNKQILSITGIRRAGKTTIMKQLIHFLLDKEHDPKTIFYFSFDEIIAKRPSIIEEVLDVYKENILKREIKNVFIFFDEIQHIEKWEVILKRYYDLEKGIKYIVSGSSNIHIKKAKESLAGRELEFHLPCLDFSEFVYFKTGQQFQKISCTEMYDRIEAVYDALLLERDDLTILFNEFLEKGGFPETIEEEEFEKRRVYVKSIIEKVVFRDITQYFAINEPEKIMEILRVIATKPGMIINYSALASDVGMTRQTVAKYFTVLRNAFIIREILNYRKNILSQVKKSKKAYFYEHSLSNVFFGERVDLLDKQTQSFLVEGIVTNTLDTKYYWEKNHEVDIIYKKDDICIPIEIKWREETKRKMKGLDTFMEKYKSKRGIILTKKTFRKEKDRIHIPAWLFLLTVK
jgi:uncharacterized protein